MSTATAIPTITPNQLNELLDDHPAEFWMVELIEENALSARAVFHHINAHIMGREEPVFQLEFNSVNRMGIWKHMVTHGTSARLQAGRRYGATLQAFIDCKYVGS